MSDEQLLKAAHASLAITWGTSVPFDIGTVSAERIGFASDPCVVVTVYCRPEDTSALVPVVRQRVYGELAERGWTPDDLAFTPSVQQNRRRKFRDSNERSESFGRDKFGSEHRFTFGMNPDLAAATFKTGGTYKQVPTKEVADE